jgi:hypothetical protein
MDVNASAALSSYAYQTTLARTGSASRALSQALASNQSQAADTSALLASAGSFDALAPLAGGANSQALVGLAYGASASAGNGPEAVQALLASLGGGTSVFTPASDAPPLPAEALTSSSSLALARYTQEQSQDPEADAKLAANAARQSILNSRLDLLA